MFSAVPGFGIPPAWNGLYPQSQDTQAAERSFHHLHPSAGIHFPYHTGTEMPVDQSYVPFQWKQDHNCLHQNGSRHAESQQCACRNSCLIHSTGSCSLHPESTVRLWKEQPGIHSRSYNRADFQLLLISSYSSVLSRQLSYIHDLLHRVFFLGKTLFLRSVCQSFPF